MPLLGRADHRGDLADRSGLDRLRHVAALAVAEARARRRVGRGQPFAVGVLPRRAVGRVVVLVAGGAEARVAEERRVRDPHQAVVDVVERPPHLHPGGERGLAGETVGGVAAVVERPEARVDRVDLVAGEAGHAVEPHRGRGLVELQPVRSAEQRVLDRRVAGGAEAALSGIVGVAEDVAGRAARRAVSRMQVTHPWIGPGQRMAGGRPVLKLGVVTAGAAGNRRRWLIVDRRRRIEPRQQDRDVGLTVDRGIPADLPVDRRAAVVGDGGGDRHRPGRRDGQREAAVGRAHRHRRGRVRPQMDPRAGHRGVADLVPHEARDGGPGRRGQRERREEADRELARALRSGHDGFRRIDVPPPAAADSGRAPPAIAAIAAILAATPAPQPWRAAARRRRAANSGASRTQVQRMPSEVQKARRPVRFSSAGVSPIDG